MTSLSAFARRTAPIWCHCAVRRARKRACGLQATCRSRATRRCNAKTGAANPATVCFVTALVSPAAPAAMLRRAWSLTTLPHTARRSVPLFLCVWNAQANNPGASRTTPFVFTAFMTVVLPSKLAAAAPYLRALLGVRTGARPCVKLVGENQPTERHMLTSILVPALRVFVPVTSPSATASVCRAEPAVIPPVIGEHAHKPHSQSALAGIRAGMRNGVWHWLFRPKPTRFAAPLRPPSIACVASR